MGFAHEVKLPIAVPPLWPTMCVRCGASDPPAAYRFRASRVGWGQLLTVLWAPGSRPRVQFPACVDCASELARRRRWRTLLQWVLLFPVAFGVIVVFHWLGALSGPMRPFRLWIVGAAFLVACTPYIVWAMLNPPVVDATAVGTSMVYEFRDRRYAVFFAARNKTVVRS